MGRHLILACDNCIPGDASGWYAPLALALLVSLVLAGWCGWVALGHEGARAVAAKVAAAALAIVPAASMLAMATDVGRGNLVCGSALSSSLERGVPNDAALDENQTFCKERGEAVVRGAATATGTAVVASALLMAYASVPRRPRAALA
ncbi:MAG TPA: hypothetical protein VF519_17160 [Mycobacteriales bacterium]